MNDRHVDVVVIGAGASGLRTAGLLSNAGIDVLVLEARDHVGGRLRSIPHDDGEGALDVGATWFWAQEKHINSAISELDISTHAQYIAGDAMYHDPAGTQRIEGNPIDVPAGRFSGGAQQLTNRLAAQLPTDTIETSRAARAITYDADQGRLLVETSADSETSAGTVTAHQVVVALPPALASHSLKFDPDLPDPLPALARQTPVWMGSVIKVVVAYPRAFWRDDGLAGAAISHTGPMRELHDMSGPDGRSAALFGFMPVVSPGTQPPTREAIVAQLVDLFGPVAQDPSSIHIVDWRNEPYTSPPGVEMLRNYGTYGHRAWDTPAFDGRLHWASTETSAVNPGHIDGALARAETIATRILERGTE